MTDGGEALHVYMYIFCLPFPPFLTFSSAECSLHQVVVEPLVRLHLPVCFFSHDSLLLD